MSFLYASLQRLTLVGLFLFSFTIQAEDNKNPAFVVTEIPEAHLIVNIPNDPKWDYITTPRNGTHVVGLSSPPGFEPLVSMEIAMNPEFNVKSSELGETAISALNVVRKNAGLSEKVTLEQLEKVNYGDIEAYVDSYVMEHDGARYPIKSIMGILPSGRPITMFLATQEGQMEDALSLSVTIWENLKELK